MSELDDPPKSSIRELLAYGNNFYDQPTQDLTLHELPPGSFAPQTSKVTEVLTPAVNSIQSAEDLELLAQIVGDFLSLRLNSEIERQSCHLSNRIFSWQTVVTHQIDSADIEHSVKSDRVVVPNVLKQLVQEIEQLLHHRLVYERERQGRFGGYLPW